MALSFCGKRLLLTKCNLSSYQKRYGYIVLVPEIGEDLPDKNPLLKDDGLLEFNKITIEKCVATFGKQTVDIEKNVKVLDETLSKSKKVKDLFREVLNPLEHFSSPLETTWGLAKTLYLGNSSLMPTKSYLSIHDRARRARSFKFGSLNIYNTIKDFDTTKFNEEEKRVVSKYILEGKLNGLDAESHKRLQLNEVLGKLNKEKSIFKQKVDIATKQFVYNIEDYNYVREFPPSLLQATCINSAQPTKGPWKITLQPYILNSFLEFCDDKAARWNAWQAETRRGSGYNDKNLETSTSIESIRSLRSQQAKLLGYENFVQMSMETKMVGDVTYLKKILDELLDHSFPAQIIELKNLQEFAEKNGFNGNIELSDIYYWKRKYSKLNLNYDEEILREYFPLPKVITGLFEISEKIFNIKIQERPGVETWHEDVKFYDIFENSDGKEPISGFYLDLYTRDDAKIRIQQNPGWMVAIRNKSILTNTTPLSALIFNFQPPLYGKPSLLAFKDVQMLFKKFGHTLQHLLTKANYSEVAGLSNIEWDAVEIPGHVFSSLLYEPTTLQKISSHYVTEDPLPQSQLDAIQKQRIYFSGFTLSRELYLSNLDLDLHIKNEYWLDVVKGLWPKYNVLPLDKKDSQPCSWLPVFAGEYGAAYFSHVWAQMVAADAFSAFAEAKANGQTIEEVGKRFKETYLYLGGSCAPAEVFRQFRGRDPSPQAIISYLRLNKSKKKLNEEK